MEINSCKQGTAHSSYLLFLNSTSQWRIKYLRGPKHLVGPKVRRPKEFVAVCVFARKIIYHPIRFKALFEALSNQRP